MDNRRRDSLKEAIQLLGRVSTMVDTVCDKEQDCVDNYRENLQGTERFERMEDAVDNLNEALEKIDDAKSCIQAAIVK